MVRFTQNLLLLACGIAAKVSANDPTLVQTAQGPVQGSFNEGGVRVWRGIPYAAAPTGKRRFTDSVAHEKWTTPIKADTDGAACIQHSDGLLPPIMVPTVQSEDCLFLNVFAPNATSASSSSGGAPVLVFFHGGNFKIGYGGGPLYDGTSLAADQGVILVSINYRLNSFGFLFSSELDFHGNYGISDQRRALEWIQENIAAFGGDPNNVAISGQSAGGASVAVHLVSPLSQGLFHKAIMESNPMGLPMRTQREGDEQAKQFLKHLGCDKGTSESKRACVMQASADVMRNATVATTGDKWADREQLLLLFMPWVPTINETVLPGQPLQLMQEGKAADVPMIIGTTTQEGVQFVYEAFSTPIPKGEYELVIPAIFGVTRTVGVLHQYPPVPANDTREIATVVATDSLFHCPLRNSTLAARKSSVFFYSFAHVWNLAFAKEVWGDFAPECWEAVCHGADLPFIFFPEIGFKKRNITFTAQETALARDMGNYFGSFVHSGQPASGHLAWEAYSASSQVAMWFNTSAGEPRQQTFTEPCALWDRIGYNYPYAPH